MSVSAEQIDAILPQTQCGLCTHGGCLPYAKAIVDDNERIDLCPPGGVRVLKALGELTGIDPTPYLEDMQAKTKPTQTVIIREDLCIGCTKCIQACPVDAILGASKAMHTVIQSECTGCELCIEPCPMDCIDIIEQPQASEDEQIVMAHHARQRFDFRTARLERDQQEKRAQHLSAKAQRDKNSQIKAARQAAIQASIARVKAKKQSNRS